MRTAPAAHFRYALFLLVVTLAAGEAITRILAAIHPPKPALVMPSPDDKLVYELNPAYPEINHAGMRQEEIDSEALKNKIVIAMIGDSHTFSAKVKDFRNGYPARTQANLEAIGRQATAVLNFGVPGYNTAQELEVLKAKAAAFHPKLVILQYTINDTHVCNYIRPMHPRLNALIHRSAFAVWLWREILYSNYGREKLFPWVGRHLPDLLLHQEGLVGTLITVPGVDPPERLGHPAYREEDVPEHYHYMLGEENFARHLGEFGETARQLHAKLLATGFIEKGQEEIFRRAGFDVYSFYEIFDGLDLHDDGGYSPSGTTDHFSEAGNEIIARKLAAYIAEKYL